MNRKGIESIISVIVLVFIALAFLGVAYTMLSGQFGAYTKEQIMVSKSLSTCDYGKIKVYATTTDEVLNSDRLIRKEIIFPGATLTVSNFTLQNFPLKRGQQSKQIIDFDCWNTAGGGCGNGEYTIVLATSSVKEEIPLTC